MASYTLQVTAMQGNAKRVEPETLKKILEDEGKLVSYARMKLGDQEFLTTEVFFNFNLLFF
jgi:predicted site-specific integrase-resolvase